MVKNCFLSTSAFSALSTSSSSCFAICGSIIDRFSCFHFYGFSSIPTFNSIELAVRCTVNGVYSYTALGIVHSAQIQLVALLMGSFNEKSAI